MKPPSRTLKKIIMFPFMQKAMCLVWWRWWWKRTDKERKCLFSTMSDIVLLFGRRSWFIFPKNPSRLPWVSRSKDLEPCTAIVLIMGRNGPKDLEKMWIVSTLWTLPHTTWFFQETSTSFWVWATTPLWDELRSTMRRNVMNVKRA